MSKKHQYKSFRRRAEQATVGQPEVAYYTASDGSRRLDPRCTRAVYQWLKGHGR